MSITNGILIFLIPIIFVLIISFALAYIPANIARKKGYGFMGFYILGLFFFFIALIISLCLSDKNQQIYEIKQAIHYEKYTPSTADELRKYSELLEQGRITQEEFNSIKEKLIHMYKNCA